MNKAEFLFLTSMLITGTAGCSNKKETAWPSHLSPEMTALTSSTNNLIHETVNLIENCANQVIKSIEENMECKKALLECKLNCQQNSSQSKSTDTPLK